MPVYQNRFQKPKNYTHVILDSEGAKIGTLRLKPNRVLWKPVNEQKYYSVGLDDFIAWITSDDAPTRRTKS